MADTFNPTNYFQQFAPYATAPPPWYQGLQRGMNLVSDFQRNMALPQMLQAELGLKQAQAQREQSLANLPFGGQQLPGMAGQIMGLESIKQMYGEQSPQYAMAKDAFDMNQQRMQAQIGYQNMLTGTAPVRYLTPTGKGYVEQNRVAQGLAPTGGPWEQAGQMPQQLALGPEQVNRLQQLYGPNAPQLQQMPQRQGPESAQEASNAYGLLRQKGISDSSARQKNLYATNIEKTLERIDPDDLTRYAGAAGGLAKLGNEMAAPFGKETKDFRNFVKASRDAELLAHQVRQFYGDSIQPSMIARLEKLTNPSYWGSNPELAKELFNETKIILGKELDTYRQAMKSTAPYQGQKASVETDPLGIR